MHFKLIIVMVEDEKTNAVLKAAREAGATGATVLNQARGEGITPSIDLQVFAVFFMATIAMSAIGIALLNRLPDTRIGSKRG